MGSTIAPLNCGLADHRGSETGKSAMDRIMRRIDSEVSDDSFIGPSSFDVGCSMFAPSGFTARPPDAGMQLWLKHFRRGQ